MKIKVGDGEYPFPEMESISYREATLIKKLTGLRLGEFGEAFEAGDTDMLVGLAAVAVFRDTGRKDLDYLLDLNLDAIQFVVEEEDAELPPTDRPEPGTNGSSSAPVPDESAESGIPVSSASTA